MATLVKLVRPPEPADAFEVCVLGIGSEYDELERERQASEVLTRGAYAFWWSHSIRPEIQPLLANGFSLLLGQKGGTFIAECHVQQFSSNAQGHVSPFPTETPADQQGKASFGVLKSEQPRTWFLIDRVTALYPPVSFADVGPAALQDEAGEEYCERPRIGSWGYRWRDRRIGTGSAGPAATTRVGAGGSSTVAMSHRRRDPKIRKLRVLLRDRLGMAKREPKVTVFFRGRPALSCEVEIQPDGWFATDLPRLQASFADGVSKAAILGELDERYADDFRSACAKLERGGARVSLTTVANAVHGPIDAPHRESQKYSVPLEYQLQTSFLTELLAQDWPSAEHPDPLISLKVAAAVLFPDSAPLADDEQAESASVDEEAALPDDEEPDIALTLPELEPSGSSREASRFHVAEVVRVRSPPSLIFWLPGENGLDPSASHARRKRIAELIGLAHTNAGALLECLSGTRPLQDEIDEIAAGTAPRSRGRARALKWADQCGEGTVVLRLGFPSSMHRTGAIKEAEAAKLIAEPLSGPTTADALVIERLEATLLTGPAAWQPTVREVALPFALPTAVNVVLEGVPGTGKTFFLQQIRDAAVDRFFGGCGTTTSATTLHPATSYEDFVEGIRPGRATRWISEARVISRAGVECVSETTDHYFLESRESAASEAAFSIRPGFFLAACKRAAEDPSRDHIVLLDEINRCNVPKVFGDLLTTLERSKRARWDVNLQAWDLTKAQTVTLPYSGRILFVPDNLYVVATMNSTDRSVAPMDAALRRRFAFRRVWPKGFETGAWDEDRRADILEELLASAGLEKCVEIEDSLRVWSSLNARLLKELGPDGMLGHSYLFDLAADLHVEAGLRLRGAPDGPGAALQRHWNDHILPQLADVLETNNMAALTSGPGKEMIDILGGLPGVTVVPHSSGKGMMQRAIIRLGKPA